MEEATVSRARTTRVRKPKKSQIPIALVLTVLAVVVGYWLSTKSDLLPIFWLFGLLFGYVLQRSRFCFTAGFRDPVLTGSTSLSRAILVALAVGTVGVTALKFASVIQPEMGTNILTEGVAPIGIPLILGAIIFGVGMVIAGGCASGTFMRVGEGFQMQWLSIIFFIIGSTWGAHDMGAFWSKLNEQAPKIFLPDLFGWFGALIVQFTIIVLLYIATRMWQKKKLGTAN